MKRFFAACVLLLVLGSSAWADTYYCLLFAYDSKPIPTPCQCHVWGTFIQVDDDGKLVEEITVSWEPDKLSYIDRSGPGWNASLKDTLDHAVKKNRNVRMWGPYQTEKDFYEKAKVQYNAQGKYKFFDGCSRKKSQNCIHRLSDIAGPHRTGIYWGWWAADSVYRHYRRQGVIIDTDNTAVVELLELDDYSIKRMR